MKVQIACETLAPEALAIEIAEVVEAIDRAAKGDLSIMYCWSYDVPDQYEPLVVPAGELKDFIADSSQMGIYGHGKGDFWIKLATPDVDILFCHESDIHLTGAEGEFLLDHFRSRWLDQGIRVWQKLEGETEWTEARQSA